MSSSGEEPFDGQVLRRFLEKQYRAKQLRQTGSHVAMQLPDGRLVRCAPDSQTVTKSLMRWNARILGVSYSWLRSQIVPIQNKSKPHFKPRQHQENVVSKKDVITSLDGLMDDIKRLKNEICQGDRDPSVYRRVSDAARSARNSIRGLSKVRI